MLEGRTPLNEDGFFVLYGNNEVSFSSAKPEGIENVTTSVCGIDHNDIFRFQLYPEQLSQA
ncbi:hypothetical protein CGZ75_17180 [Paenibacillus herberti]|uniref:Uncharacterized protein n=1 Tax=Paenibacillus herberti TaxID=1619309 RepID=A0A229NXC1_9BACL|nr:hypothetical protein CGZ75_17180 [Paenibacillus herberti]